MGMSSIWSICSNLQETQAHAKTAMLSQVVHLVMLVAVTDSPLDLVMQVVVDTALACRDGCLVSNQESGQVNVSLSILNPAQTCEWKGDLAMACLHLLTRAIAVSPYSGDLRVVTGVFLQELRRDFFDTAVHSAVELDCFEALSALSMAYGDSMPADLADAIVASVFGRSVCEPFHMAFLVKIAKYVPVSAISSKAALVLFQGTVSPSDHYNSLTLSTLAMRVSAPCAGPEAGVLSLLCISMKNAVENYRSLEVEGNCSVALLNCTKCFEQLESVPSIPLASMVLACAHVVIHREHLCDGEAAMCLRAVCSTVRKHLVADSPAAIRLLELACIVLIECPRSSVLYPHATRIMSSIEAAISITTAANDDLLCRELQGAVVEAPSKAVKGGGAGKKKATLKKKKGRG